MVPETPSDHRPSDCETADHLGEARHKARQMLGAESHLVEVDDWRRSLVSARDALMFIWLTWVAVQGIGVPAYSDLFLIALAFGLALLTGISTGRSTHAQVQYYESELERERYEIRHDREHEREEVRVLYAAKGFHEPLLGQIVDTLSADDDRLLKVMMEEELGLSMHHVHHPVIVGLWNFAGALVGGMALAVPLVFFSPAAAPYWVIGGGSAFVLVISWLMSRTTRRSLMELSASSILMAAITGGAVYYLAQWLASLTSSQLPT